VSTGTLPTYCPYRRWDLAFSMSEARAIPGMSIAHERLRSARIDSVRAGRVQLKINFYGFSVEGTSLTRVESVFMLQPEWSPDLDVVLDVGKDVGAVSQDEIGVLMIFRVPHEFQEREHVFLPYGIVSDPAPPFLAHDKVGYLLHIAFEIRPEVDGSGAMEPSMNWQGFLM
jgi:hypothetical protein